MAAVIRVKRRIDEEPLNAFVLNCKRRKLDEEALDSTDETSTVLKFAGTVNSQDDFMKVTKEKAERIITKVRNPNLTGKSREDVKQNTQNSRFKIVNCSRPIDFTQDVGKNITVVDIERQGSDEEDGCTALTTELTDKSQPTTSRSAGASRKRSISNIEENYVYDVYVTDGGTDSNIDDNLIENLLSVQPFDLVYDHRGDGADSSDDEHSEDSNSENNWRNDYPEESDNSIDENDMRQAVARMAIDDEIDLSSDDDDAHYRNGFVYSIDSENIGFEDDIDYCDVNRYGEAYARYKARVVKKALEEDSNDEEISDLDGYYDSS